MPKGHAKSDFDDHGGINITSKYSVKEKFHKVLKNFRDKVRKTEIYQGIWHISCLDELMKQTTQKRLIISAQTSLETLMILLYG